MNTRIRRFRKILSAKELWRDEERKRLAEERKAEDAIRSSLESLCEERIDALREFSKESGRMCTCMDLWFRRQVVDAVDKTISERNLQLSSIREQISGTEIRLTEKHRDVRIMETFIGNLVEEDKTKNARYEQEELDDFAGIRYQGTRTEGEE
jgi:flagellar export protein FliJ